MSGASAGKNASIKSYKLVINGVTYSNKLRSITKSGTVTVTARITDRGQELQLLLKMSFATA